MAHAKVTRAGTRDYLAFVLDQSGMSIRELATAAGVAASTLYRIVDEADPYITSQRTLAKIEEATGLSYVDVLSGVLTLPEAEAQRITDDEVPHELRPLAGGEGVWRLNSRALELCGFLPGDVVVFDIGAPANRGDIVLAQTDADGDIIRRFEPPYLVSRRFDCVVPPLLVDGVNVRLIGRLSRMLRIYPRAA